jgi:hypothetical protein
MALIIGLINMLAGFGVFKISAKRNCSYVALHSRKVPALLLAMIHYILSNLSVCKYFNQTLLLDNRAAMFPPN